MKPPKPQLNSDQTPNGPQSPNGPQMDPYWTPMDPSRPQKVSALTKSDYSEKNVNSALLDVILIFF